MKARACTGGFAFGGDSDRVADVRNRRNIPNPASMPRTRAALLLAGAVLVLSVLTMAPAAAQTENPAGVDDSQVVLTGSLVVGADETVDAAVILNGSALV